MNQPFYTSDRHIHSVASYDAHLHMGDLVTQAEKQGLKDYGLSDHVNAPCDAIRPLGLMRADTFTAPAAGGVIHRPYEGTRSFPSRWG